MGDQPTSDRGLVVIVDDDASSADTLQNLLQKDGYAVEHTASGGDVVETIASADANLVLLDTHLAHADAFDLLAQLKQSPHVRDIPVIFMTALEDTDARLKGLESGDDLIIKPFDAREVLARIERQVTVSKVRMALRESEAKFRSVMESAIDAIISGDAEGKIRSWNSAATALFGFTEAEVIGKPIEIIIPDRYHEAHQEGVRRVSSGGPSHVIGKTVELAAVRKDGTEFPVELSLATWLLDDVRYYTGIIRDISERKQAEEKFRSVTESAIDAIISADHDGEHHQLEQGGHPHPRLHGGGGGRPAPRADHSRALSRGAPQRHGTIHGDRGGPRDRHHGRAVCAHQERRRGADRALAVDLDGARRTLLHRHHPRHRRAQTGARRRCARASRRCAKRREEMKRKNEVLEETLQPAQRDARPAHHPGEDGLARQAQRRHGARAQQPGLGRPAQRRTAAGDLFTAPGHPAQAG